MKKNVEIHIEELVLHGFPQHERFSIGEAFEAELTRLFTEQGLPQLFSVGGNIPTLNAGTVNLKPNVKPASIGNNIAHSVFQGFSNDRQSNGKDGK